MDRVEQRHEALDAVGQGSRRDRQPLIPHPGCDPVQRTQADTVLEEKARPDADPVGRVVEQPLRRGRGHFQGRGGAVATPAPACAQDPANVGLDLDLDLARGTLAVGDIGLAAAGAGARGLRRIASLLLLAEPGPRGATVPRRAALLAALAPRTLLLLLLAPAPEQRLRQRAPGRLQSGYPGFQSRDPATQRLYLPVPASVRLAERNELVLPLLRAFQCLAQPGILPGQGIDFPAQRPDRVLVGPRCRRGLGRPDGSRIPRGFRRPQIPAQPDDFHAQRRERAALARIDAGLRKQLLQPRHFRLVE